MKKIWVYILGILTGIIITIIIIIIIGAAMNPNTQTAKGMTFFEQPGEIIEPSSVKVFQCLCDGAALAYCLEGNDCEITDEALSIEANNTDTKENFLSIATTISNSIKNYGDPVVLVYNEEGNPYYDDQIINAPKGKCFRQVGVFRYSSPLGNKTVPIVMVLDK